MDKSGTKPHVDHTRAAKGPRHGVCGPPISADRKSRCYESLLIDRPKCTLETKTAKRDCICSPHPPRRGGHVTRSLHSCELHVAPQKAPCVRAEIYPIDAGQVRPCQRTISTDALKDSCVVTPAGFTCATCKASILEGCHAASPSFGSCQWTGRPGPLSSERGVLIAELGFLVSAHLGISTGGDTHRNGHRLSKRILVQNLIRGQKGERDCSQQHTHKPRLRGVYTDLAT